MFYQPPELKNKPILPIYISVVSKKKYTYFDKNMIKQEIKDIFKKYKNDFTLVVFTSGNSVALTQIHEELQQQLKDLYFEKSSSYIHDYLKFVPVDGLVQECEGTWDEQYINDHIRDAMTMCKHIYLFDTVHSKDKGMSYELDQAYKVREYMEGFGIKEQVPQIIYKLI